jgi:glutaminase
VAPTREQVQAVVNEAYDKFKSDTEGKNADYIPVLAEVDSKLFGVVVVATDGQIVSDGDIDHPFSIQSISKVFSLALAMDELGADQVFAKIGSEPTGRPFNSVEAVVDMPTHTGKRGCEVAKDSDLLQQSRGRETVFAGGCLQVRSRYEYW